MPKKEKIRERNLKFGFLVLPFLDVYWIERFAVQYLKNLWDPEKLWGQIFLLFTKRDPDRSITPEVKIVSVVGALAPFWDFVLSMYILCAPEVYKSPKVIAGMILQGICDVGVDPAEYENFKPYHYSWLEDLWFERKTLLFLREPQSLATKLRAWTEIVVGLGLTKGLECLEAAEKNEHYNKVMEKYRKDNAQLMEFATNGGDRYDLTNLCEQLLKQVEQFKKRVTEKVDLMTKEPDNKKEEKKEEESKVQLVQEGGGGKEEEKNGGV